MARGSIACIKKQQTVKTVTSFKRVELYWCINLCGFRKIRLMFLLTWIDLGDAVLWIRIRTLLGHPGSGSVFCTDTESGSGSRPEKVRIFFYFYCFVTSVWLFSFKYFHLMLYKGPQWSRRSLHSREDIQQFKTRYFFIEFILDSSVYRVPIFDGNNSKGNKGVDICAGIYGG